MLRTIGLRTLRRTVKAELPAATKPLTAPRCLLKYKPGGGMALVESTLVKNTREPT